MKIKNLKINGFGKIENKEIILKDGINLIHGNNENGKTTILKFITAMFYGLSKNKNGKEKSDLEKYTPWSAKNFSGKIEYSLDNNEQYQIYRNFLKKDIQILNSNHEEISNMYPANKINGNLFFIEQTGVDEELFLSTLIMEQGQAKLNKNQQSCLIQKITNLLSTGKDNMSYKKSIDKLNKKMIEEIGNDRTSGRPINILKEKIDFEKNQQEKLQKEILEKHLIDNEKKQLIKKQETEKAKIELMKKTKNILDNQNIEREKIKINCDTKKAFEIERNNVEGKIANLRKQHDSIIFNKLKYIIGLIVSILGASVVFFINKNIATILLVILVIIFSLLLTLELNKKGKKKKNILKEIEILIRQKSDIDRNIDELNKKINKIENNLNKENETVKEKLQQEYSMKISLEEINDILDIQNNINEIIYEQEKLVNEIEIKLHTYQINENNIKNKENELEDSKLKLDEYEKELSQLEYLRNTIIMVKENLEIAYKKTKENITPKLKDKLEECASKISRGKYNNIFFDEENGLTLEIEDGRHISIEDLSMGTIEQMYLALRINILSEIINEKMPIILDEPFVYYDGERLNNILEYLNNNYWNRQIIIFSCSNREIEALNNLNIKYNRIKV